MCAVFRLCNFESPLKRCAGAVSDWPIAAAAPLHQGTAKGMNDVAAKLQALRGRDGWPVRRYAHRTTQGTHISLSLCSGSPGLLPGRSPEMPSCLHGGGGEDTLLFNRVDLRINYQNGLRLRFDTAFMQISVMGWGLDAFAIN